MRRVRKVMGPWSDRQTAEVMRMIAASLFGYAVFCFICPKESERKTIAQVLGIVVTIQRLLTEG